MVWFISLNKLTNTEEQFLNLSCPQIVVQCTNSSVMELVKKMIKVGKIDEFHTYMHVWNLYTKENPCI